MTECRPYFCVLSPVKRGMCAVFGVLLSVRTFSQLPSKVHASIATGQQALEVSCHSIGGQTEAWNLSGICFL